MKCEEIYIFREAENINLQLMSSRVERSGVERSSNFIRSLIISRAHVYENFCILFEKLFSGEYQTPDKF